MSESSNVCGVREMKRLWVAATLLSCVAVAGCSRSTVSERRGVIEDIDGCELSRTSRGWSSVTGSDPVIVHSRRMRYATVRVHRSESAEALAADVREGRLPPYAAHEQLLQATHAAKLEIGGAEYPVWWVGSPNIIAYVFVPSKEAGYVFLVWVDLPRMFEEETEASEMQHLGRLLRPLVRSLEDSPVEFFGKCLPDA